MLLCLASTFIICVFVVPVHNAICYRFHGESMQINKSLQERQPDVTNYFVSNNASSLMRQKDGFLLSSKCSKLSIIRIKHTTKYQ